MYCHNIWYILPFALILDLALGDPRFLPHPIRWMGSAILFFEAKFRKFSMGTVSQGALFAVVLIFTTWLFTFIIVKLSIFFHPAAKYPVSIILIYYTLSSRSLEKSAMNVFFALKTQGLDAAKNRVKMIVGRQVENLTEKGVSSAAVETVAENLVDGFISPLFYAALGGAPLAMAYKMVNTLDSMIGYKNKKYIDFGKTAARIDDIANYIPARLSVLVIALAAQMLSKKGSRVIKTAFNEGTNHTSPNAGFPEASFAGAMGVKLGGPNYYHGKLVSKPFIGAKFTEPEPGHIKKACELMLISSVLWTGILSGFTFAIYMIFYIV